MFNRSVVASLSILGLVLAACAPDSESGAGAGAQAQRVAVSCEQEIFLSCPEGQVDGCDSGRTSTHTCVSESASGQDGLDPSSDVMACAKSSGKVGGTSLVYAVRSLKKVQFEKSSGGRQSHDLGSIETDAASMTIRYRGTAGPETIVVDLKAKTALWSEDANPEFSHETYTNCIAFPKYDRKSLSDWVRALDF